MPRYDPVKNQYVYDATGPAIVYTANGAIQHSDGVHAIAKTSAAAMTLTPPLAGEEGMRITITGRTAFAHTVVITEGLGGKGGNFDTMTYAAVGDSITLLADNLHWVPIAGAYGVAIA